MCIRDRLIALRENQSKLEAEMLNLCKQLPEYETVMAMYGVGKSTGPHLMAELGDVRRFPHRSSIVAFAGVDPGVVGSGKMQLSSVTTSKRGSPQLRKALFQVVSTYVKCKPENEAVYQFYAKKRDEGKPFFVCTTAAANKFLRIYYARVKEMCIRDRAVHLVGGVHIDQVRFHCVFQGAVDNRMIVNDRIGLHTLQLFLIKCLDV